MSLYFWVLIYFNFVYNFLYIILFCIILQKLAFCKFFLNFDIMTRKKLNIIINNYNKCGLIDLQWNKDAHLDFQLIVFAILKSIDLQMIWKGG